jgi:hypothetical protein
MGVLEDIEVLGVGLEVGRHVLGGGINGGFCEVSRVIINAICGQAGIERPYAVLVRTFGKREVGVARLRSQLRARDAKLLVRHPQRTTLWSREGDSIARATYELLRRVRLCHCECRISHTRSRSSLRGRPTCRVYDTYPPLSTLVLSGRAFHAHNPPT